MKSTKVYVEYLDWKLDGTMDSALGDRGTVILDGRNRLSAWIEDARKFNGYRRPFYPGFRICRGETILYEEVVR